MASVPYPLTGESIEEVKSQLWEIIRQLYEEKIGGADLGDVFSIVGDVLTLVISPSTPGLTKAGNQLAVLLPLDGGLTVSSTGVYIKNVSTGGLQVDASGIAIKLDGTTLSVSASGLKVNTTLIDVGALVAERLVATDVAKTLVSVTPDAGWSVTNVTEDKSFDANTAGCTELADVLGTLINTLIEKKVLSA